MHFVLGPSEQCVKSIFTRTPANFFWIDTGKEILIHTNGPCRDHEHVHKSLDTTDDAVTVSNLCYY